SLAYFAGPVDVGVRLRGGVEAIAADPSAVEPTPTAAAMDPAVAAELAALRARVDTLEAERKTQPTARPRGSLRERATDLPFTSIGFGRSLGVTRWGVRFSGYIQAQYQSSQLSEDQLQQGGGTINRDRFVVRRGRVRASGDWQFFAFELELDGSTTRGPFVGIRQAHVSALWRNPNRAKPPYLMVTAGLTEVPFGYEVRLGQRDMLFMERTVGSLAYFAGPVDVGVRLRGGVGALRYDFAVMNGTPLDDRAGGPGGIDPTKKPDVAGRVGFEVLPSRFAVAGGVSFLAGTGFHAGTDATKNNLEWQDLNENGSLDTGETVSVPGTAALPSENFKRWAVNADLQFGARTKAGWTRIFGEATVSTNLDRALLVSDPVVTGADVRQVQAYAAVVQDATRWALIGARWDFYDGNADLLDTRRGSFVPAKAGIHTISPLVGAVLPTGVVKGFRGRLVLQYDISMDKLGRDGRGVPVDLRNNALTVRLQGEF
ncbi:MAG: hypothetical protein IAG13_26960, partial [Deltaproteobacteria bacterium]|nr:hypothetical protein [Nannocystaceae bacterium]